MKKAFKVLAAILFPPFAILWLYKAKGAKPVACLFAAIIAISMINNVTLSPEEKAELKSKRDKNNSDASLPSLVISKDDLPTFSTFSNEELNVMRSYSSYKLMKQGDFETTDEFEARSAAARVDTSILVGKKLLHTHRICSDRYSADNNRLGLSFRFSDLSFKVGKNTNWHIQYENLQAVNMAPSDAKVFFNGNSCVDATVYGLVKDVGSELFKYMDEFFREPVVIFESLAVENNGIVALK